MTQQTQQIHAHKQVYETATEMAHELYDKLMSDNALAEAWRRQNPECTPKQLENRFVAKHRAKCIPAARATLAAMLTGPYDDAFKSRVHEALVLDMTLKRGRASQATPSPLIFG